MAISKQVIVGRRSENVKILLVIDFSEHILLSATYKSTYF